MAAGAFALSAWAQAPAAGAAKGPQWKDQGEYDIAQKIQKENDPQKKLDLIKDWEQKYPTSDFGSNRDIVKVQTLGAMVLKGLQPNATAADSSAAEKAARDLIDNANNYFSASMKPAQLTDAQWTEAKQGVLVQSHMLIGMQSMNKKSPEGNSAAEAEFRKVLELNPNVAQVSYWLGTTIMAEKDPKKYPEALYDIAHSIDVTGQTALPEAFKTQAKDFLKKAYDGYHGSDDGLDDLLKAAATSPTAPPGFTIQSVTDVEAKKNADDAQFAGEHPDLAFWRNIKAALTAPDTSASYFEQLKGAEIPPQSDDAKFKMFSAKVISQPSPKELLVNVDSAPAGDAVLQFDTPLKGTIDPGTDIKFKGVVDSFTPNPYVVTFTGMDKEDVDGIPATAFAGAPASRRRAAPKKK